MRKRSIATREDQVTEDRVQDFTLSDLSEFIVSSWRRQVSNQSMRDLEYVKGES